MVNEVLVSFWVTLVFKYVTKDWRVVAILGITVATVSMSYSSIFVPESPKWLSCQNRKEEANQAINYLSRMNGMTYRELIDEVEEKKPVSKSLYSTGSTLSISDYLANRDVIFNLVCMSVIWLASSFCYFVICF